MTFGETRELSEGRCGICCWKIANKGPLIRSLIFATSTEQWESDMLPALATCPSSGGSKAHKTRLIQLLQYVCFTPLGSNATHTVSKCQCTVPYRGAGVRQERHNHREKSSSFHSDKQWGYQYKCTANKAVIILVPCHS